MLLIYIFNNKIKSNSIRLYLHSNKTENEKEEYFNPIQYVVNKIFNK